MKIGIRIDNFLPGSDPRVALPYQKIRELARMAEESGLDSIWLADHLFYRFDPDETVGPWECWTLLSALAETTTRIDLGTIVLCNPFRNPALLAKMAHTLDEISGGRLILGVGAGWHQPEFDAYGYPFDHRVDRYEEALQVLRPLLKGKSVDFFGEYHRVEDCFVTPLGPRPEGIPLLIAAFGPRMMRLTAQYADLWNTAWLGDPQEYMKPLANLRSACVEVARDMSTIHLTAGVSIAFPDLGDTMSFAKIPLTGTVESLAKVFERYSEAGTAHLIIQLTPFTLQAIDRLKEVVNLYRKWEVD